MFILRRSSFNISFKHSFGNILKLSSNMDESGVYRLDKRKFDKVVKVPSVRVPVESITRVAKALSDVLFRARHIKNMRDADDSQKVLLLNPDKCPENTQARSDLQSRLQKLGIDLKTWSEEDVHVTYDNASLDDALKEVLPSDSDGFGGFSNIGHIVHVNLKETILPYKYAIGEILLDKVSTAKTVVNKINSIDSKFRTFSMELLAGQPDYIVECREHGITYKFDFSKVYWNPRLATEHQRIVQQVKKGDTIYDVFAGVGPFAIPAAKKGCRVIANDLNPESCNWLRQNVQLNKVHKNVSVHELDGRDFITTVVKADLESLRQSGDEGRIHILMNLPALAVEFVSAFRGLLSPSMREHIKWSSPPTVHCYCFSKSDQPEDDARQCVERALGCSLSPDSHEVRRVRNVAPNKDMLCVTFSLLEHVLFAEVTDSGTATMLNTDCSAENTNVSDTEPVLKRPKHDSDAD